MTSLHERDIFFFLKLCLIFEKKIPPQGSTEGRLLSTSLKYERV